MRCDQGNKKSEEDTAGASGRLQTIEIMTCGVVGWWGKGWRERKKKSCGVRESCLSLAEAGRRKGQRGDNRGPHTPKAPAGEKGKGVCDVRKKTLVNVSRGRKMRKRAVTTKVWVRLSGERARKAH